MALAAVFCIAAASDPAERMPDPAQEARAKAIFAQVRCVVCQNESIDDSEADLARDLRRAVREQIAHGATDQQARAFLVDRYGEFVLLKPAFSLGNAALWLTPFAIVGIGALILWRRPRVRDEADDLSPEEQDRLRSLKQP